MILINFGGQFTLHASLSEIHCNRGTPQQLQLQNSPLKFIQIPFRSFMAFSSRFEALYDDIDI